MKDALPDRYQVDRIGTPDPPDAQYYVLDLVHDFEARVTLRGLVRKYRRLGLHVRADELEDALNDTEAAHRAVIEARTPKQRQASKRQQRVARS